MGGEVAPDQIIAEFARHQHGVVARRQLIAAGLSHRQVDRRIAAGRLHPVHRGVYAIGHRLLGARGRWWAALLACGDASLLSHETAGHGWRIHAAVGIVHITVSRAGRAQHDGVCVHRRRPLAPADITQLDGMRITTPARTVLDLAARGLSGRELERVLDLAEQQHLHFGDIDGLLRRSAGQPGTAALREVLGRYAPGSVDVRSRLEEMCIELCDAHGISRPSTNVVVAGRVRDLFWPGVPLVVEADSYRWHRSPDRLNEDRARDVSLTLAGIAFLRFTYEQIADDPGYVVSALTAALGSSSLPMR